MENLNSEQLIVRLIKDALTNRRLILGLNSLGLTADNYTLFLGDTIFLLMGFEKGKSDFIFEKIFLASTDQVMQIEFSHEEMTRLSIQIYQDLLIAKDMFNSKD